MGAYIRGGWHMRNIIPFELPCKLNHRKWERNADNLSGWRWFATTPKVAAQPPLRSIALLTRRRYTHAT